MAVPLGPVKQHIRGAVNTAVERVKERATELFSSEIASTGNGTASPFHKLLFPEAKIFSSFERALSASLGKAFEYIAADIARATYGNGTHDYKFFGDISPETITLIETIINSYRGRAAIPPNTEIEIKKICETVEATKANALTRQLKSDIYFVDDEGVENYLQIKTPMPNYDTCAAVKTQILQFYAVRFGKAQRVRALAGFPHNPNGIVGRYAWPPLRYFLDPKIDWFARGKKLMGPGLWNFLGNSDTTYDALLECFYEVSVEQKDGLMELLKTTTI
jgi:hypothetical protein